STTPPVGCAPPPAPRGIPTRSTSGQVRPMRWPVSNRRANWCAHCPHLRKPLWNRHFRIESSLVDNVFRLESTAQHPPSQKESVMSLDVPTALLERAERGEVSDDEFVECVRTSLPYAYEVVSRVAGDL